jgi:GNAT superfamily N-acetyltransferase
MGYTRPAETRNARRPSTIAAPMSDVTYRRLERRELARVGEIDRTERIETLYVQRGVELDAITGDFSASPWHADGDGEHSVAQQVEACERWVAAGGIAIGAFTADRLVAIGIVVPHIRAGVAQLAFLHVSGGFRGAGIGVYLVVELERLAREAGDARMVVSATPSANTVSFYRGRGFEPTATPLPELYAFEPDDVHLEKRL